MPHDPYAELVERLNAGMTEIDVDQRGHAIYDIDAAETTMSEAGAALARLSAPVTDAELTKAFAIWWTEYSKPSTKGIDALRAALAAHRAGRGMV